MVDVTFELNVLPIDAICEGLTACELFSVGPLWSKTITLTLPNLL